MIEVSECTLHCRSVVLSTTFLYLVDVKLVTSVLHEGSLEGTMEVEKLRIYSDT